MSKYEKSFSYLGESTNVNKILIEGESIIWQGKPKKIAFIINKVLYMLPFALLWLLFDSVFIMAFVSGGGKMWWFVIPFFAIHLMPVWSWLGNVLTANKKWQNTEYVVTDRRIVIITGIIGMDYQTIYYKDIENVELKIGFIDKLLGVGDIFFDIKASGKVSFLDIENSLELYTKLQKVVLDIQTDIEFPNNLRPSENDGYNTKYNGSV